MPLVSLVSLVLVEAEEKLKQGGIEKGKLRILSKASHWGRYGDSPLRLVGLKSEFLVTDNRDGNVHASYLIRSKLGGELSSWGNFREGRPVILQQMKVGKKWRACVLTASVLRAGDYLEEER